MGLLEDIYKKVTTLEGNVNELSSALKAKNQETDDSKDELLTEIEASKLLKVTRQTLKSWRDNGKIPFQRVGSLVRYNKSELLKKKGAVNA